MIGFAGFHLAAWQLAVWGLLVLLVTYRVQKLLSTWQATPGVRMAALAAVMCTFVSGNSSWRYFGQHLGVNDTHVRALLFCAGETGQFALALMARENYLAEDSDGGGIAGVLVWVISGVTCVPAFAEGGVEGGLVRSALGPVFAAFLWHLAMGVELVRIKPSDKRGGSLGKLARFVRESLLASLGLVEPDRNAQEIVKDRAVKRAVFYGVRYATMSEKARGRRRGRRALRGLQRAVRRAEIGSDRVRRLRLLQQLAAARNVLSLVEMPLPAPWARDAAALAEYEWAVPPTAGRRETGSSSDDSSRPQGSETDGSDPAADNVLAEALEPEWDGLASPGSSPWGFGNTAVPWAGGGSDTSGGYRESGRPRPLGYGTDPPDTPVSPVSVNGTSRESSSVMPAPPMASQGAAASWSPAKPAAGDAPAFRLTTAALGPAQVAGYREGMAPESQQGHSILLSPDGPVDPSPDLGVAETAENAHVRIRESILLLGSSRGVANGPLNAFPHQGGGAGSRASVASPSVVQETRWTRRTEELARKVAADLGEAINCRDWVRELRRHGGQVASKHVTPLYQLVRAPAVPAADDVAE